MSEVHNSIFVIMNQSMRDVYDCLLVDRIVFVGVKPDLLAWPWSGASTCHRKKSWCIALLASEPTEAAITCRQGPDFVHLTISLLTVCGVRR